MKTTLLFAAVSTCILAASSGRANLLVNGGFETGGPGALAYTPPAGVGWFNTVPGDVDIVADNAHSGNYAAALTDGYNSSTLQQSVTLMAGEITTVDLWAKTTGVGVGGLTLLLTDGSTGKYFTPSTAPFGTPGLMMISGTTEYTEYNYSITSPISSGYLVISWGSSPAFSADDPVL